MWRNSCRRYGPPVDERSIWRKGLLPCLRSGDVSPVRRKTMDPGEGRAHGQPGQPQLPGKGHPKSTWGL